MSSNPKKFIDVDQSVIILDKRYPNFQAKFNVGVYPEYHISNGEEWLTKFEKLNNFAHHLEVLEEAAKLFQGSLNIIESRSVRYFKEFQELEANTKTENVLETDRTVLENWRLKGRSEGLHEATEYLNTTDTLRHLQVTRDYIHAVQLSYVDSKFNILEQKRNQ